MNEVAGRAQELSLICRNVGDHALLVGDDLHLAWHFAYVDETVWKVGVLWDRPVVVAGSSE